MDNFDQFKLIAVPSKLVKQKPYPKPSLSIERFIYDKYKIIHTSNNTNMYQLIEESIDSIILDYKERLFVSQFVRNCITNVLLKLNITELNQ